MHLFQYVISKHLIGTYILFLDIEIIQDYLISKLYCVIAFTSKIVITVPRGLNDNTG